MYVSVNLVGSVIASGTFSSSIWEILEFLNGHPGAYFAYRKRISSNPCALGERVS